MEHYEVIIPATVIHREVDFYREKSTGERIPVDLTELVADDTVQEYVATASDIADVQACFDRSFREGLDAGELEALAYLRHGELAETTFVTADGPAVQAAAMLGYSEHVCSLEEALQGCGITKDLPHRHTTEFVEQHRETGTTKRIQGTGLTEQGRP